MPSSVSSNSQKLAKAAETTPRGPLSTALTWLCRIIVGGAFALGGWSKSIDPYGTMYKMLEYLNAWGFHSMPHEPVVMAAVALGALELTIGVCVLTGILRHSSAVAASAVMLFMMPLSGYIAIAEPVADCSCFGDVLVVGNTTTFLKNVLIGACCAFLLVRNNCCQGLFARPLQWIVVLATVLYALVLAAIGYNAQPTADFRPYPLGTVMALDAQGDDDDAYLPAFDEDGEEVDVFRADGTQLVFVVPDPGEHFLTRSRFTNELAEYAARYGTHTAALVGTSAKGLKEWKLLAAPAFEAYSADDTDLKSLVRGDIAAVYLRDGAIVWKRNLASVDADLVDAATPGENALETISRPDDGSLTLLLAGIYLGLLLLLAIATLTVRLTRR